MKIIILFCFSVVSILSYSQDPSFSQPSNNLTYLNPAFTGTSKSLRTGLSYRNQWPGITGSYVTTNISVDQYLGKWGGVGVTYVHDLAGAALKTNSLYLDYAYQINIGEESVLSLGVEIGYIQKNLDWSKLTFGHMIDPRHGFVYPTANLPIGHKRSNIDLGAGVLYYNKFLFAGYGLHHINQPNLSFYVGESKLPMLHSFYAGGMINIGEFTVSPQVDFKAQGSFQSLIGIVKANYKWITFGTGLRSKDAFVGYLGVTSKRIKMEYSYDYTVSKLSSDNGGSHEISLQLRLNTSKKTNGRALEVY